MRRKVKIRGNFDVDLVQYVSVGDEFVCKAARVSTLGAASLETEESAGLIKFLMSNRHGSPFEHNSMTWRISAPIFVWREFMRHRIASYNEQSGRYMEMDGVFYIPNRNRNLVQVGKPGHYTFQKGTYDQWGLMVDAQRESVQVAWDAYRWQLKNGVAKEVARMHLPLSIYSTAYVTMNARGLMNFLSLRTKHEDSTFPSYPQWEINQVADQMEVQFKEHFPLTHAAFHANGRVCP